MGKKTGRQIDKEANRQDREIDTKTDRHINLAAQMDRHE